VSRILKAHMTAAAGGTSPVSRVSNGGTFDDEDMETRRTAEQRHRSGL